MIIYLKFTKKSAKDVKKEKNKSACDFIGLKNNNLYYKCKECKKGQLKPIKGLIKKFSSICQFCNGDINKFVLLSRKGVYPYEYMDSWEKFAETLLPDKKAFYSELYLENITNKDYTHAQKIFEDFRNKCIEIYKLDPAHFLSAPRLAWQACLRKTGVKLELLTNIDG